MDQSEKSTVMKIKSLFEIKRPQKPSSSTLPRARKKQDTIEDVSTERLFTRNKNKHSNSRSNKYKKEVKDNVSAENDSTVKKIREQFENMKVTSVENGTKPTEPINLFRSKSEGNISDNTFNDELAISFQKTEVKRRNQDRKQDKNMRAKKIRSFLDVTNEEEVEEYRKSLIKEMDFELALMKDDQYMDEFENAPTHDIGYRPQDHYTLDDEFSSVARLDSRIRSCDAPRETFRDFDELDQDERLGTSRCNYVQQDSIPNQEKLEELSYIKFDALTSNIEETGDEFTETLGEDLENGLTIVETYNDDGRELIISHVIIERQVVNYETYQNMKQAMQHSERVLSENDHYTILESKDGPAPAEGDSGARAASNNVEGPEQQLIICAPDSKRSTTSRISSVFDKDTIQESNDGSAQAEEYHSPCDTSNNFEEPEQQLIICAPNSKRSMVYSGTSRGISVFDRDKIQELKDGPAEPSASATPKNAEEPEQQLIICVPGSKRSTIYSTTSRDSSVFDEDTLQELKDIPAYAEEDNSTGATSNNLEVPEQQLFICAPDSKRSTIYSTTSRDSSVFDEDDEGIEMGRNNYEGEYINVRRETFCDEKGVVRIERVAHPDNVVSGSLMPDSMSSSAPVSRSNSSTSNKKLEYIVDEIKSTERKYVEDLEKVVLIFKPYIEQHTPSHLSNMQGYLFGNIEKIFRKQKKFLAAIEESGKDVNKIVKCFMSHERLFAIYPKYFRNKPKADRLLKDFNLVIKGMMEEREERLDFSAYLLTPVQRLGKYILFLENIEKELKKSNLPIGSTQMALDIVRSEMSKGNDYVAIDSIRNSPISELDYGSFRMRENFVIVKPKRVEAVVFLFQNVVVITTVLPTDHENFNYYDSIKMNDLRIATFENLSIHLTDYTKSKKKFNSSRHTYVLEAKTEKIWNTWRENIETILWQQLFKVKELTMTESSTKKFKINRNQNRIKSTGTSLKDHRSFTSTKW